MQTHPLRVVAVATACLVSSGATAPAADHLLRGTVASAAGEKLGGVTVSAKAHGSTITTSVYTDEQGGYYFPPRRRQIDLALGELEGERLRPDRVRAGGRISRSSR